MDRLEAIRGATDTMQKPLGALAMAWQRAMQKRLEQEDPQLAERLAMQATPRLAEIESQRTSLTLERDRLESRIRDIQAKQSQDEDQLRSDLTSISLFRQHLAMTNRAIGQLVDLEPGARRRTELESQRSEACRCVGVGGTGRVIAVAYGVPLMEKICEICTDGIRLGDSMARVNAKLDEEAKEQEEAIERVEKEARITDRLERSGIPSIYHTSTFRTVAELPVTRRPEFIATLRALHDQFKETWKMGEAMKGVYLYGPAGHGKTSVLSAIARKCIEWDKPVMFTTVLNLLDSMRAGYGRRDGSSDDLLNRAKTITVLILDDLGMQQGTDHERARLLAIISERHGYGRKLLTCYSSNYTLHRTAEMIAGGKDAEEQEVARIERRLRDMADETYLENLDLSEPANRRMYDEHHGADGARG